MTLSDWKNRVEGKLIVSCQALKEEPLHGSEIMARMARAAKIGGASGIRANGLADILAIKNELRGSLPIIGIIKNVIGNSNVYITPTLAEVEALVDLGVEVIAVDATLRKRPDGLSCTDFLCQIRKLYPNQLFMGDISSLDDAKHAVDYGIDMVGPTLYGYTDETLGKDNSANDFEFIRTLIANVNCPIIAEGKINTPEKAKRVLDLGACSVVVGGAITRPQEITARFVNQLT